MTNLSHDEKIILSQLDYLSKNQECNATNSYLSQFIGKSNRTVQRIIAKLIELGLITKEIFNFFQRKIKTTFAKLSKVKEKVLDNIKKPFKKWQKFDPKPKAKHDLDMIQRDGEELEDFELRCAERESLDDVRIRKTYNKAKNNQNANAFLDLKRNFLERKFKNNY